MKKGSARDVVELLVWFILVVGACVCLGRWADAQEPIRLLDVSQLADGKYLATKAGNSIRFQPAIIVNDDPIVVPPTPPGSLGERTRLVAAQINDPATARDLAVAYSVLLLRQDKYDSVTRFGREAKQAATLVLRRHSAEEPWQPFRQMLTDEFTKAAQEGRLNTVADYAALLTQVRDGLVGEAATAGSFNLGGILELIQAILPILTGGDDLDIGEILQLIVRVIAIFGGAGMEVEP